MMTTEGAFSRSGKAEIEIRGLVKRFGVTAAVAGLDLAVPRGTLFGLIGPDGAGKTTTLRIVCGLLRPDAGSVRVAGIDVAENPRALKHLLGYMPQRFSLYPDLTVGENLRFFGELFGVPPGDLEKRTPELLAFTRLAPFLRRRSGDLSGGMKQKLGLACALIHTPRVLVLDEPTTGVDPISRQDLWELLRALVDQGVTVLLTTPYMDEASLCHRIALIHRGGVLAEDEPGRIVDLFPHQLYEIRGSDPRTAARLLQEWNETIDVQRFGDSLHLSVGRAAAVDEEVIGRRLAEAGIGFESVRQIRAGVEDTFVELMKSGMDDEGS